MDPQYKLAQSPGTPLYPVSPDRINQQKMSGTPVPPDLAQIQSKHGRAPSEVQAKVAFLNSLSASKQSTHSPGHSSSTTTAALQRAILGREEAESALQNTMSQLAEANARERRVSERLESLMEELHSLKERQAHERVVFEKEVRKARKEAFRAGSTLVKAQEELKFSRGELKLLRDQVKSEREAKEQAKQEAFERAYALAGMTEELQVLRDRVRSYETDNQSDVLEARAEEMRGETPSKRSIIGERQLGTYTPTPQRFRRSQLGSVEPRSSTRKHVMSPQVTGSALGSPVKMRIVRRGSCKENKDPETAEAEDDLIEELRDDLKWEQRLRQRAEDMVQFLKMECQFNRCSCRIAESQGIRYVCDAAWEASHGVKMEEEVLTDGADHVSPPSLLQIVSSPRPTETQFFNQLQEPAREPVAVPAPIEVEAREPQLTYCPDSGTFKAVEHVEENECLPQAQPGREPVKEECPIPSTLPEPVPDDHTPVESPIAPAQEADHNQPQPMEVVDHAPVEENVVNEPQDPMDEQQAPSRNPTFNPQPRPQSLHIEIGHRPSREHFDRHVTPVNDDPATTTTSVPLRSEDSAGNTVCPIPGTPVSREQALAQIRARRDRTQSALKRSASANDASSRGPLTSTSTTPIRGSRRIPRMENSAAKAGGPRRDISAPIRPY